MLSVIRNQTEAMLKTFRYDKLNRIKRMLTATPNGANWGNPTANFAANYFYDFNGNITSLYRNKANQQALHHIAYQYYVLDNRLRAITATGLNSSAYQYDAVGNLTHDSGEGLQVAWNAAGKVDMIRKGGSTLSVFHYSPTGQRQVKQRGDTTDYYLHDAAGNVMCIYAHKGDTLTAIERPFYGSKRLGESEQRFLLGPGGTLLSYNKATIGLRRYELTDHLGNVMAVISDRKIGVDTDSDGYVNYYAPEIIAVYDYYPYGYPIRERCFSREDYRYGFNGQESDAEVYGTGSLAGYEFRQYDTRLGRWWGMDQKASKYPPFSPYQFCAGNPIRCKDMDGSDFVVVVDNSGKNKTITIQMNIYTVSQEAHSKLSPAVEEINNITKVVTIDGVEYTLKFAINPVAPDSKKREDYHSNLSEKEMMIVNAIDQARDDGCYGNAFMGSTEREKSRKTESGTIHIIGGQTSSGKCFSMNIWGKTRFIEYHKLISHEILHLLGLDDKGKTYYTSGGRMEYTATPDNGFEMKDISNDDIRMIIKYMLDNNNLDVEGAKVRIDYINGSAPIDPNAKIKVE